MHMKCFFFTVEDKNDNPPKFDEISYSCYLSETATRGQLVSVVSASDPDSSDAQHLQYAITKGNELQVFSIDSKTGIMALT